jgi:cytochrome c
MKKIIYWISMMAGLGLLIACSSKTENKNKEEYVVNEAKPEPIVAQDAIAQGEALVKANDCKTCHHPINKIIGPAHIDVARKYEFTKANVEMLANKIIKGGVGVWGQVPMNPHPDISLSDAEKMARYVLSLNGQKEH